MRDIPVACSNMGGARRQESAPPPCEYIHCSLPIQAQPEPQPEPEPEPQPEHPHPTPDSALGTAPKTQGWRLMELSEADGDVFDLSFVFDRNWWVDPCRQPSLSDAPPAVECSRRDCCAGVLAHSFELHHVLSRSECEAIVRLADDVGFQRPTCGGGIGSKEESPPPDRMVWVTDRAWCDVVFGRCAGCLPMIQGRRPVEINPRWRLYRYEPGFGLDRHQDRSFKASGADAAGELRYDVRRDGSESLLTLLIYLNEGMEGGGTMLYARDDGASALEEVTPSPGSALLFPHGRHNPDSVWHAGLPVVGGVKYIIRTDVVYEACQAEQAAPATAPGPAAPAETWDEELARSTFRCEDENNGGCGWLSESASPHPIPLKTVRRVWGNGRQMGSNTRGGCGRYK